MNEQQVLELFDRTGSAVRTDVRGLVDEGRSRGRARRRRRGAAVTAAAASVLVAGAATAIALAPGDPGGDGEVAGAPEQPRTVAVSRSAMSTTLAGLIPDAQPLEDAEPYQAEVQRGVVTWHGRTVSLTLDLRSVGIDQTAAERCRAFFTDEDNRTPGCEQAPGGAWLAAFGETSFTVDDDATSSGDSLGDLVWIVRAYEPEGYVLEAQISAEARDTDDGASAADQALLRSLVLDDVWLD